MDTKQSSGQVIDRPTGELAALWMLYADLLEKHEALKAEARRIRKQTRRHEARD